MSRIFNSRGLVVIDYDKVEAEAYLVMALVANCRCITVNVPKGQLLYLGNRTSDALAAMIDGDCEVFYTAHAKVLYLAHARQKASRTSRRKTRTKSE